MLALFSGLLATKVMGVSTRFILIGFAALAITLTITGGWLYVKNLQSNLVSARSNLAREELLRKSAEAGIKRLSDQVGVANAQVDALKAKNAMSSTEWLLLESQVFISPNLPTAKENFDAKLDAVNRGNRAANRMLRSSSGAKAPGKN